MAAKAQKQRDREIALVLKRDQRVFARTCNSLIEGDSKGAIDEFLGFLCLEPGIRLVRGSTDLAQLKSTLVTFLCVCKYVRYIPYDVGRMIAKMALASSQSGMQSCSFLCAGLPLTIWHPLQTRESRKRWIHMFETMELFLFIVDLSNFSAEGESNFRDLIYSRWMKSRVVRIYWGSCNIELEAEIKQHLNGLIPGDGYSPEYSIDLGTCGDPKERASDFIRWLGTVLEHSILESRVL
jgi:hypothetical protein